MSRGYLDIEKLTNDGWTLFRNIHGPNSIASEIRTLEYFAAPDVVEVVRCKDCKHFEQTECPWDEFFVINVNDYCSRGERKEGEE